MNQNKRRNIESDLLVAMREAISKERAKKQQLTELETTITQTIESIERSLKIQAKTQDISQYQAFMTEEN